MPLLASFPVLDAARCHILRQPNVVRAQQGEEASRRPAVVDLSLWSSSVALVSPGYFPVNGTETPFPLSQTAFPEAIRNVVLRRVVGVSEPGRVLVTVQSTHCEILDRHQQ